MEGWIKLHRCLTQKAAWECTSHETHTLLIVLLLMVNHEERHWLWGNEYITLLPGQCITSIESLAKKTKLTPMKVRTSLKNLENLGFLTNISTKKGRLITIENWGFYQGEDKQVNKEPNKDLTKTQQRLNKGLTINKNDKNVKNEKNDKKHTPNPSQGAGGGKRKNNFCVLDMLSDSQYGKLNTILSGEQIVEVVDEIDKQYTKEDIRNPYSLITGIAKKKGMI